MDTTRPETARVSGGMTAPILAGKTSFSASRRELLALPALYVMAYIYVEKIAWEELWLLPFTLGFVGVTELIYRGQPRLRENWFWLGCMGLTLLGMLLDAYGRLLLQDAVWSWEQSLLFLHVFAVWYVLSRGGRFLEGESGHLLPADAVNGFVRIPFRHFFLCVRTLLYGLGRLSPRRKGLHAGTLVWSLAAALLALGLFSVAAELLMAADAQFEALLDGLRLSRLPWDRLFVHTPELLLSLPVAAYLFGLIAGSAREERETLRAQGAALCRTLETLRRVPPLVWLLLTGGFCLLYLAFFAVHSRYLFGAFTRTLPEGFIVSQYAREGFFELCRVMAVNFVLLWLVTRSSAIPARESRALRGACTALLAESLLFALIAASKLWLYIDCFGFTPLRLQSCWGVGVLAAGCGCAMFSLLTGRRSLCAWLGFSALSASLLCLF